ncbi:HET domain-containing protein [Fusarium keratoplasticum]|uniref:HET domain-containing protein n=1 Tax=Fusarium keratoplasticum TaxID=1328300 RepID=A0ACC0QHD2_9HYPO|nr:HET domain-containing protein [Fusarium keratoplasticum]KAI8651014.1 HET domain-containing protein [Fusarium keratoplasticum]
MARFLDAHDTATTILNVQALLRPEGMRKSAYDIHEILLHGGIVGAGISARDFMHSHFRFKVYACPGDQAAAYISSRSCDLNVHSSAAFVKIRSWVADCDTHHQSCPRPVPVPLPTRVLDLQNQNTVRIHEAQTEYGQYAALSYCWGSNSQSGTPLSNDRPTCLATSALPRTIQDAITVTRQIGLKYLWVDAFCIIQDSVEDKGAEIGQMAQYYQNASVTIIAANARSSDKGFLASNTQPRCLEPDVVSYQFQLSMAFPDDVVDLISAEYCIWDNGASPEPLDRRAWAYQEQILCRRALTYGTSTMTWRCEQGIQGWNSWLRKHQSVVAKVLPKHSSQYPYKEAWKNMVAVYSHRNLTFPEDKLPAISALASQIHHLSVQSGGGPGRYLAGLWEDDLLDQLIWFAAPRESHPVQCIPYRAPSWSWASVECPVLFLDPRSGLTLGALQSTKVLHLEIIDCGVTLRSALVPLGQVTAGRLRVRGRLVHGSRVPNPEAWLLGAFRGTNSDVVLKLDCYSIGDKAGLSKARSCWWLQVQHRHGLVLEHVDGAIYRRVGCVVRNWPESSEERRIIDLI